MMFLYRCTQKRTRPAPAQADPVKFSKKKKKIRIRRIPPKGWGRTKTVKLARSSSVEVKEERTTNDEKRSFHFRSLNCCFTKPYVTFQFRKCVELVTEIKS